MKHRYRVHFNPEGTPPRDVTASSPDAAKRCAVWAERLVGNKTRNLKACRADKLWQVGYQAPAAQFLFAPCEGVRPA